MPHAPRAADGGDLDNAGDTGGRLAGLHRVLELADAQFRHQRDQQSGVGMERRRQDVVDRALLDHPAGIEQDDANTTAVAVAAM